MLYADPECGRLSDLTLALLLGKLGIRWEYCPLEGLLEVVWPPICGVHLVQLEHDQSPAERRFALRHALGHVLGGHCTDLSYAHDGHDWQSYQETVADGFALLDLVSDVELRDRLTAGWDWRQVRDWTTAQLLTLGPTWDAARTLTRTEERLWMFAEREAERQEEAR